jgi:hypothetical protein
VRPVKAAAPAQAATGYPRRAGAWRWLAGAPIALASAGALADVTPPPGGSGVPGQVVAARLPDGERPRDPKQPQTPNPNPTPKQPDPIPILRGKIACPRKDPEKPKPAKKPDEYPRPKGDIARAQPPSPELVLRSEGSLDDGFVIHPHGPDEPCEPIGARA